MEPINLDSKIFRAWNDFNKVSIKKIPDAATFQKLISLSPKIRSWYQDWSFNNSAFSQMPSSFKEHGVTPAKWEEIASRLPEINLARKESSARIEVKAKEFSVMIENEQMALAEKLAKLENEYVKILKINITCLPIEDQLEILSKPEEDRENVEKIKLEALRTKLLKDLADGDFVDPFIFGDFKDLLS
uniref:Uncharacterized protein n=1 Tax=viral metagenome TaxID=1070528 RepID=A0A2V0RL24_9ZZZZ